MLHEWFIFSAAQSTRSLVKILAFVVPSNAKAPACEVIENGARVCLVKYQIVIIEFCVT